MGRAILRGRACSDMSDNILPSAVQMAEAIDLPFGLWTGVGRRKHKVNRICQVSPCALMGGTLAPPGEYD